jgi:peptidyl-dipeptidase Dcp
MELNLAHQNVSIRTELRAGDLGYVIYRHGKLYYQEKGYGIGFEAYVAQGLAEFYRSYDAGRDRVWICEDEDKIVGFLLAAHRGAETAQFRFFYLEPEYRGIGLAGKMMQLFMDFLKEKNYRSAYLVTTDEQLAGIKLYERYGFTLTEEKPSNTFGKPLVEQRYDLNLENYES